MGRETYFPQLAILVPKRQSCACLRGQYTLRKITRHSNQVPRLNLRSARGTAGAPLPAISCLGAFWTPAATARGRVRHAGVQKPCMGSIGVKVGSIGVKERVSVLLSHFVTSPDCICGMDSPLLGCAERSSPKAACGAPKARGLTANAQSEPS